MSHLLGFPRSSAELIKNTSTISPTTLPTVKDALDNLQGRTPSALPVPIAEGGTGQITAVLAFNALSPLTTLGDILTNDGTNDIRLAVGAADTFLGSTGAAAPSYRTAAQVRTSLNIVTGSYTPTLTNTTNLDGSTSDVCNYCRINDFVMVWGNLSVDPTTTGVATRLGVSLPIASNFAATTDLGGSMGTSGATGAGRIFADTGNDRADFSFIAPFNVNGGLGFSFGYFII